MRVIIYMLVIVSLSGCDFMQRFEDKTTVTLEIDTQWALHRKLDRLRDEMRDFLRHNNVPHVSIQRQGVVLHLEYKNDPQHSLNATLQKEFPEFSFDENPVSASTDSRQIVIRLPESVRNDVVALARDYNIDVVTRLLNDRNIELKLKIVGLDRFEIEVAKSKIDESLLNIITQHQHLALYLVSEKGRPHGFRVTTKDHQDLYLQRDSVITGASIIHATASRDDMTPGPVLNVVLDDISAEHMKAVTQKNLHRKMAVIVVEYKYGNDIGNGFQDAKVLSVATIQGIFGKRFMISGIESTQEAETLAYHMRAGELATPQRVVRVGDKETLRENRPDGSKSRKI